MKSLARKLRHQSTDTEQLLWKHLRAHRMAGYKFKHQVVIEPYIVDFVCLEAKLIIEADGGQHLEQLEKIHSYLIETPSPQPSPGGRGGQT